jgi:hypothetical protein
MLCDYGHVAVAVHVHDHLYVDVDVGGDGDVNVAVSVFARRREPLTETASPRECPSAFAVRSAGSVNLLRGWCSGPRASC